MKLGQHAPTDKDTLRNECHIATSEGESRARAKVELRVQTTLNQRTLNTNMLMEKVVSIENIEAASKRVIRNKGAGGVDGMKTVDLKGWLTLNREGLIQSLLDGTYQPQPVRRADIPKPAGGTRKLGIPVVIDRLVQQAILQVLSPVLDPLFSEFSYGFREKRSAHDALLQAKRYVEEGREIVVDIDLEKFFDTVNHDILMARLARHIHDKRILRIVRKFLQAGIMHRGVCVVTETGTPQGGPLSPILANLLLDDLDKLLEQSNHKFCRYADDCNIYVRSMRAGERVMARITKFLEEKLRLKINREKSQVSLVGNRKFLGYTIMNRGSLAIAHSSIKRFKEKVIKITGRNRGVEIEQVMRELKVLIPGWVRFFRFAKAKELLNDLDKWIRRKLRCYRLKQWKRTYTKVKALIAMGVSERQAWNLALSGKGLWRLSATQQMNQAMDNKWFEKNGLVSLEKIYLGL